MYGFVMRPILGPPAPALIHWECAVCEVGWKSRCDVVCWACGSSRYVAEYGSVAALETAQALRRNPIC